MGDIIPIIAIDGTAGSGKGTLAQHLAQHLHYGHLDTGKLYRGIAYLATTAHTDTTDVCAMVGLVDKITPHILAHPALTSNPIGNMASQVVSRIQAVRDALFEYQRTFPNRCAQNGYLGAVVDGRDIGSVIFPDAPIKFFVTAHIRTRAKRRFAELSPHNPDLKFGDILSDLQTRDHRDSTATVGRLIQVPNSIFIDTTHSSIEHMVKHALLHVKKHIKSH